MNIFKRIILASLCPFIFAQSEIGFAYGVTGASVMYENQNPNDPSLSYKVAVVSGDFGLPIISERGVIVSGSILKKFRSTGGGSCFYAGPTIMLGNGEYTGYSAVPFVEAGFEMYTKGGTTINIQLCGSSMLSLGIKANLDSDE